MRLTTGQTGIISYSGLDKNLLLTKARLAFAQSEESVPMRFSSFLPLFPVELVQNMSYIGKKDGNLIRKSASGFSINPIEYHQKLYQQMPELYQGENRHRNFDYEGNFHARSVITVDHAWATAFPQYEPFLGERLFVHMIGGGHQAVAVPESIYPRGRGVLHLPETEMQVVSRCNDFVAYMKDRMAHGEAYNPIRFEQEYLDENELSPVLITQSELGRIMQDLSIIKDLQGGESAGGLYTQNAKRAEHICQYLPFRYASDIFESIHVTRSNARLVQLYFEGNDFISDLWMPYQDVVSYMDRTTMTLDVSALCNGFQIAPTHNGDAGGKYPTCARVVVVRDRSIRMMQASTINNPAYGTGMNPLGMINRLLFISESRELLRQHKLSQEDIDITCENTELTMPDYLRMEALAQLQEHKGRLIDAMYRRESALSQMEEGTKAYKRAKMRLDGKVKELTTFTTQAEARLGGGPVSGYDADIHYLSRKQQDREDFELSERSTVPPFAIDPLRELSIESGYAMRSGVRFFSRSELYDSSLEQNNE